MIMVDQQSKWVELLTDWVLTMQQLHQTYSAQWEDLGLPDIRELVIREPDYVGIAKLQEVWGDAIDLELIAFYSVTDGWPLWLGSYLVGVPPVSEIALLRDVYRDAFDIAISNAPATRKGASKLVELSKDDLNSALVVSEPDARELVLSLSSHETCLYFFDGMRVFSDFFEFMSYQKEATRSWLADMV